MSRPLVATDTVRFVGDIIAVVVSEDRVTGADAAELVVPDYEPLQAVVSPRDAARDEVLLFRRQREHGLGPQVADVLDMATETLACA